MRKIRYIFKESLAKELCNKGNNILCIRKDYKNKSRCVFLFEESDQFIKDFTKLSKVAI